MKRNRRILSLLLAICLVAALLPTAVFAAEKATLAEYVQDDQIVSFANKEWIVIDSNSTELVLLLKTPEAPIAYNASGLSNAWDTSDAKTWCESAQSWFTEVELNALSAEKVFFLSHDEIVTYWVDNSIDSLRTTDGWWLRYDGENVNGNLFGIAVSDAGFMGTPHVATNYGARPAIKIPVANVAALILPDGEDVWQLKVVDNNFSAAFSAEVTVDATTATVSYSNYASNSTVYAVLCDRLGQVISYSSKTADGSDIVLNLPKKLVGWYSVRVFNEVNGVAGTSKVIKHDFSADDGIGNVIEWNVNVGGDITANFNIELSEEVKADIEDGQNAIVSVTHGGKTKEILLSSLNTGTATDGKTECVKLPVDLTAPQMTDEITLQISSGDKVGGEQVFTVREYAEAIIAGDFNDSTKDLARHMLNYGAKAQIYFNYKTTDLANKNSGEPEQDEVPNAGASAEKPNTVEGISFYGASLVLKSQTTLRFYFTLAEGKDISTFGDLKVNTRVIDETTMYFVDIVDIAPDKLNDVYSVSVNGVEIVRYNPMWYIQRQYHNANNAEKFTDLLKAMYNYYVAADAYAK